MRDYTVDDIDRQNRMQQMRELVRHEMAAYLRELEEEEKYEECVELKSAMDYLSDAGLGYVPLEEAEDIWMMWVQLLCVLVDVFADGEGWTAMYATSGGVVCRPVTRDEYVSLAIELARRKSSKGK